MTAFRMNPDEERVLAMLDGNPISCRELAKALRTTDLRVRNAMRRLVAHRLAKRIARGVYQ